MSTVIIPGLTIEPQGNLIELQVTGPDETELRFGGLTSWSTAPLPTRTVACTLSVDSAIELRDALNAYLRGRE